MAGVEVGGEDGFLVEDESVIDGEGEEHGGEADADDVEFSEEEAAEGESSDEDEEEHDLQFLQGPPGAVSEVEEAADDEEHAKDGADEVTFHAATDFGHEGGLAGDFDLEVGIGVLLDEVGLPMADELAYLADPSGAATVVGDVIRALDKDGAEAAVGGGEEVLFGGVGSEGGIPTGDRGEAERVVAEAGDAVGGEGGGEFFAGFEQGCADGFGLEAFE
ncbi:MAG: hypothetical protein RI897_3448 [Verrucomicrobiota bacterium]